MERRRRPDIVLLSTRVPTQFDRSQIIDLFVAFRRVTTSAYHPGMTVLETERLTLRRLTLDDAPFILRLVNEPSWLEFIGDKGVRNLDDARKYLREGPIGMYERHGFGLYRTDVKD